MNSAIEPNSPKDGTDLKQGNNKLAQTGAEVILSVLKAAETEYIFCSPIAAWAPLWEALATDMLKEETNLPQYMNCRHELLAVGLASGYYKASGKPQIVLLPTGFGVLNGAMALRTAYHERTPMTILAPDTTHYGEKAELDPGWEWPMCLVDHASPVRHAETFTKWGKEVKTSSDIETELRRAMHLADIAPRGPTIVSIPFELMMQSAPRRQRLPIKSAKAIASSGMLRDIAELISLSRNPVFVTEYAGRSTEDVATLVELAEKTAAPVFESSIPAFHNFPRTHPLHGKGPVDAVLDDVDLLIVAGCNSPWTDVSLTLNQDCKVVVFDEDPMRPRAPYWGYQTDYCVPGDVPANLAGLLENLPMLDTDIVKQRRHRWEKHFSQMQCSASNVDAAQESDGRISTSALFNTLSSVLPENAVIVDEIVAHHPAMMDTLFKDKQFKHVRGWCGGLGTGISTALGVKLAQAEELVVCIIGDGAYQYNPLPACFGFSQQYEVPILIVICNNERYESQTWNIKRYFPEGVSLETGNMMGSIINPTPDYSALAKAYNGYGACVSDIEKLESSIANGLSAIEKNSFAVLDVRLADSL